MFPNQRECDESNELRFVDANPEPGNQCPVEQNSQDPLHRLQLVKHDIEDAQAELDSYWKQYASHYSIEQYLQHMVSQILHLTLHKKMA